MSKFDDLWNNHPTNQSPPLVEPCTTDGSPNFTNQCCIRMGVALTKSGIKISRYPGVFCWHGHGKKHPLRVEEMKLWLNSDRAKFVGKAKISRSSPAVPQKTFIDYLGKRGIVAFINFWGEGNQGDHIDLWNGESVAHGSRDYFERSEQIWYWKMT